MVHVRAQLVLFGKQRRVCAIVMRDKATVATLVRPSVVKFYYIKI